MPCCDSRVETRKYLPTNEYELALFSSRKRQKVDRFASGRDFAGLEQFSCEQGQNFLVFSCFISSRLVSSCLSMRGFKISHSAS